MRHVEDFFLFFLFSLIQYLNLADTSKSTQYFNEVLIEPKTTILALPRPYATFNVYA